MKTYINLFRPKLPNKLAIDIGIEPLYWELGYKSSINTIWSDNEAYNAIAIEHKRHTISLGCFYVVVGHRIKDK